MDIRIGDYVKFISEKLEGKVTSIINNRTFNVYCDEYGFEIPADINDLIVVKSDTRDISESNTVTLSNKSIATDITHSLFLSITKIDEKILSESRFSLDFINDTKYLCMYSIAYLSDGKIRGVGAGNCNSESSVNLGTYTIKDIDEKIKAINFQVIFYKKGDCSLIDPINTSIKLFSTNLLKLNSYKSTKWFKGLSIMKLIKSYNTKVKEEEKVEDIGSQIKEKFGDTNVILTDKLIEKKLDKLEKEQKKSDLKSFSNNNLNVDKSLSNVIEVDLHIDKLLDSTQGMGNKEMLDYQLDVFVSTLEKYKLRRGKKIVFIHGKGDGVLRQRMLWTLQTKFKRFGHQDASFKKYGYGATMVTIK